jgi:hypothetical protein
MNRRNVAIAAISVALALSAAAFTMPTRQALAWGFFGSTKVDQRINQLNKCTNQSPDNNYHPSSYDPNSDSLNQTTSDNHGNIKNQVTTGNANNQTTSDNHGDIKTQVSSGDDNSDNKQPNSGSGDEKHNNNHLVICVNKANNLAQFN